jgi:hypothetical protein
MYSILKVSKTARDGVLAPGVAPVPRTRLRRPSGSGTVFSALTVTAPSRSVTLAESIST